MTNLACIPCSLCISMLHIAHRDRQGFRRLSSGDSDMLLTSAYVLLVDKRRFETQTTWWRHHRVITRFDVSGPSCIRSLTELNHSAHLGHFRRRQSVGGGGGAECELNIDSRDT